ncbi:MAG: cbb3-type cytochrome c oxidase subunit 3 [Alphaproteobacteria bacterium]|nr:cbb3-type cytochrome c oxidase subunit 3 [Alphaproteobacteria bacterium]MCB9975155.1 cbb3-type cytochrome c oxidase subunit 3 [Rhodospirillales bacterium]
MIDWISQNAGLAGLLFFFLFFVLMALWVYRPGAKKTYQDYASIPLKEGDYD